MSSVKDYVTTNYLDDPEGYQGSHQVVVFGKPNCRDCEGTKVEFGKKGVDYKYVDATEFDAAYEAIVADGFAGFPVVWASPGIDGAIESAWCKHNKQNIDSLVRDYVADQGDTWDMA